MRNDVADARAQGGAAKPNSRAVALDREAPCIDVAAWTAWLRTMRWDWWATPTFRNPTSPAHALQAVTEWLRPLGPQAYAAAGLQRGPQGDRLHVHVVVGGTGRHPTRETLLRGAWRRGDLDLKGYSPAKGAIEYLVRQADAIELLGTPQRWRPR